MDYDVIVIGAGSGGIHAAKILAKNEKSVALIEENTVGGVCLNTGCIPVKVINEGLAENPDSLLDHITFTVDELKEGTALLLNSYGVTYIEGQVTKIFPDKVAMIHKGVQNILTASHIIIATGSKSFIPKELSHLKHLYTPETIWGNFPKKSSVTVIGGGISGCEIAFALAKLENTVTLLERDENILLGFPKKQKQFLKSRMKQQNISLLENFQITNAINVGNQVCITSQANTTFTSDYCIVCAGRIGNLTKDMLQIPEISIDENGFIDADFYGRTAVNNVFCIGDANGQKLLANYAEFQGECVASIILQRFHPLPDSYIKLIPETIFTDTQVSIIGNCPDLPIYPLLRGTAPLYSVGMANIKNCKDGEITIFRNAETDLLEGAYVIGDCASEMIHVLQIYILHQIPCTDILQQIFAHPTISEAIKIAIEETYEGSVKLLKRRRRKCTKLN